MNEHLGLLLRDERGVLTAWCDDALVAVDQWRLAEAPARHHLAAEIAGEVFPPNLGTVGDIKANHVAGDADGIEAAAVDRRRAARPFVVTDAALARDLVDPELFLCRLIEAPNDFIVAAIAHAVDLAGGQRAWRKFWLADPGRFELLSSWI